MSESSADQRYFFMALEEAFGFPVRCIEEILPRWLWRVEIPGGEACLKCFRRYDEAVAAAAASQYLHERGFGNTPRIIPAREGRPLVRLCSGFPPWWVTLTEWIEHTRPYDPGPNGENLVEAARVLARFHVAIRGFRQWPAHLSTDNCFARWDRIAQLTHLLPDALSSEKRPHILGRMQTGLETFLPLLEPSRARTEGMKDRLAAVLEVERERGAQQHLDVRKANFLVSKNSMFLMDLAELQPGPRIFQDVGHLAWVMGGSDEDLGRALAAYHNAAPLSSDEVALLPILNDPIHNWGFLVEGYLGGDWTDEMITSYYDGAVATHSRISRRLQLAADVLAAFVV